MSIDDPSVIAFKASPPQLAGIVERPALVQQLQSIGTMSKWLSAPSGSGKSTLAASYGRCRGKRLIWYRLDSRDVDPVFFYGHFAAAVGAALADGAALPNFANEDHANEAAFAERFIAGLCRALSGPAQVVFDDAHRLTSVTRLQALASFVMQADAAVEILFVSEEPAPLQFYDAVAARRLALCNDLNLAFDAGECATLAAASRLSGIEGNDLAVLTGGHAGALVLACEFLRGTRKAAVSEAAIVGQIHQHLLDKMLNKMSEPRRELLLRTAFAPQFSAALATELAGAPAASELDALVEHGLLRRATASNADVYEAHGLVRRGMQTLLSARLGESAARQHVARTADALIAHGTVESAFTLLVEHGFVERAVDVIESLASTYARLGHARLLANSMALLPAELVESRPWLCFWAGHALLGVEEELARRWFERSYAAFGRQDDTTGMRLAASSVVTAFSLEYGDIRGLDQWLERYANAGGDGPIPAGGPFEVSLCHGTICAAVVRGAFPAGVDADEIVGRLRRFVDDEALWHSPDQRVEAARTLIDHARLFRSKEQAQSVVLATRRVAEEHSISALQRGRWCISAACAYYDDAKYDEATRCLDRAQGLVDQTYSRRLAFELVMARVDADAKRGDLDIASQRLRELEDIAATAMPAQRAFYARMAARILLLKGHSQEGLRWAGEAISAAALAGFTGGHARAFEMDYVYALAANDRLSEAIERSDRIIVGLQGILGDAPRTVSDCLRFLHGGAREIALLRRGLRRGAQTGFVNLLARAPMLITQVCERALANDVEPEFVRKLIAVQRIVPPEGAGPSWPWAVQVRTLGGFELTINGERYNPSHKAQDKPLELFKLLICCQALGRASADKDWIGDRLWPDADPGNVRKSLDMTVSRLRRLLRSEDAIVAQEGRVRMSPRHVWTDIGPLMAALARVGRRRDESAGGKSSLPAAAAADVAAVLEYYRGPFLPEGESPWVLAGREALTSAVRSALIAADSLLDADHDAGLIPALERALAADSTSEDLARALMRRLGRQREYGEVLRVYRRLREMLSIVLSVPPSGETEQLKDRLCSEVHADGTSHRAGARS